MLSSAPTDSGGQVRLQATRRLGAPCLDPQPCACCVEQPADSKTLSPRGSRLQNPAHTRGLAGQATIAVKALISWGARAPALHICVYWRRSPHHRSVGFIPDVDQGCSCRYARRAMHHRTASGITGWLQSNSTLHAETGMPAPASMTPAPSQALLILQCVRSLCREFRPTPLLSLQPQPPCSL